MMDRNLSRSLPYLPRYQSPSPARSPRASVQHLHISVMDRDMSSSMPYLPRYQSESPARSPRRFSSARSLSQPSQSLIYIGGTKMRLSNHYTTAPRSPQRPSPLSSPARSPGGSKIILVNTKLNSPLYRISKSSSWSDINSSHLYHFLDNRLHPLPKKGDGSEAVVGVDGAVMTTAISCDDIYHKGSYYPDASRSESGVSVGESEEDGMEDDTTSQISYGSSSAFFETTVDSEFDRYYDDSDGAFGDRTLDSLDVDILADGMLSPVGVGGVGRGRGLVRGGSDRSGARSPFSSYTEARRRELIMNSPSREFDKIPFKHQHGLKTTGTDQKMDRSKDVDGMSTPLAQSTPHVSPRMFYGPKLSVKGSWNVDNPPDELLDNTLNKSDSCLSESDLGSNQHHQHDTLDGYESSCYSSLSEDNVSDIGGYSEPRTQLSGKIKTKTKWMKKASARPLQKYDRMGRITLPHDKSRSHDRDNIDIDCSVNNELASINYNKTATDNITTPEMLGVHIPPLDSVIGIVETEGEIGAERCGENGKQWWTVYNIGSAKSRREAGGESIGDDDCGSRDVRIVKPVKTGIPLISPGKHGQEKLKKSSPPLTPTPTWIEGRVSSPKSTSPPLLSLSPNLLGRIGDLKESEESMVRNRCIGESFTQNGREVTVFEGGDKQGKQLEKTVVTDNTDIFVVDHLPCCAVTTPNEKEMRHGCISISRGSEVMRGDRLNAHAGHNWEVGNNGTGHFYGDQNDTSFEDAAVGDRVDPGNTNRCHYTLGNLSMRGHDIKRLEIEAEAETQKILTTATHYANFADHSTCSAIITPKQETFVNAVIGQAGVRTDGVRVREYDGINDDFVGGAGCGGGSMNEGDIDIALSKTRPPLFQEESDNCCNNYTKVEGDNSDIVDGGVLYGFGVYSGNECLNSSVFSTPANSNLKHDHQIEEGKPQTGISDGLDDLCEVFEGLCLNQQEKGRVDEKEDDCDTTPIGIEPGNDTLPDAEWVAVVDGLTGVVTKLPLTDGNVDISTNKNIDDTTRLGGHIYYQIDESFYHTDTTLLQQSPPLQSQPSLPLHQQPRGLRPDDSDCDKRSRSRSEELNGEKDESINKRSFFVSTTIASSEEGGGDGCRAGDKGIPQVEECIELDHEFNAQKDGVGKSRAATAKRVRVVDGEGVGGCCEGTRQWQKTVDEILLPESSTSSSPLRFGTQDQEGIHPPPLPLTPPPSLPRTPPPGYERVGLIDNVSKTIKVKQIDGETVEEEQTLRVTDARCIASAVCTTTFTTLCDNISCGGCCSCSKCVISTSGGVIIVDNETNGEDDSVFGGHTDILNYVASTSTNCEGITADGTVEYDNTNSITGNLRETCLLKDGCEIVFTKENNNTSNNNKKNTGEEINQNIVSCGSGIEPNSTPIISDNNRNTESGVVELHVVKDSSTCLIISALNQPPCNSAFTQVTFKEKPALNDESSSLDASLDGIIDPVYYSLSPSTDFTNVNPHPHTDSCESGQVRSDQYNEDMMRKRGKNSKVGNSNEKNNNNNNKSKHGLFTTKGSFDTKSAVVAAAAVVGAVATTTSGSELDTGTGGAHDVRERENNLHHHSFPSVSTHQNVLDNLQAQLSHISGGSSVDGDGSSSVDGVSSSSVDGSNNFSDQYLLQPQNYDQGQNVTVIHHHHHHLYQDTPFQHRGNHGEAMMTTTALSSSMTSNHNTAINNHPGQQQVGVSNTGINQDYDNTPPISSSQRTQFTTNNNVSRVLIDQTTGGRMLPLSPSPDTTIVVTAGLNNNSNKQFSSQKVSSPLNSMDVEIYDNDYDYVSNVDPNSAQHQQSLPHQQQQHQLQLLKPCHSKKSSSLWTLQEETESLLEGLSPKQSSTSPSRSPKYYHDFSPTTTATPPFDNSYSQFNPDLNNTSPFSEELTSDNFSTSILHTSGSPNIGGHYPHHHHHDESNISGYETMSLTAIENMDTATPTTLNARKLNEVEPSPHSDSINSFNDFVSGLQLGRFTFELSNKPHDTPASLVKDNANNNSFSSSNQILRPGTHVPQQIQQTNALPSTVPSSFTPNLDENVNTSHYHTSKSSIHTTPHGTHYSTDLNGKHVFGPISLYVTTPPPLSGEELLLNSSIASSSSNTMDNQSEASSRLQTLDLDLSRISSCTSPTPSDFSEASTYTCMGTAEMKKSLSVSFDDDYDMLPAPKHVPSSTPKPTKLKSALKKPLSPSVDSSAKNQEVKFKQDEWSRQFDQLIEDFNNKTSRLGPDSEVALSPEGMCGESGRSGGMYKLFTTDESERKQNHVCIVQEEENMDTFRFKRFLKKSHTKRTSKGKRIVRFLSRLSCVSESVHQSPDHSVCTKKAKLDNGKAYTTESMHLPEPVLTSSMSFTLHHRKNPSHNNHNTISSTNEDSSPTSSNQSLDSLRSRTDSAYSSVSESAILNSPPHSSSNNKPNADIIYSTLSPYSSNSPSSSPHHHRHPSTNNNYNNDSASSTTLVSNSDSAFFSLSNPNTPTATLSEADTTDPFSPSVSLTSQPEHSGDYSSDMLSALSDVFYQLDVCEEEIDQALLNRLRYSHRAFAQAKKK